MNIPWQQLQPDTLHALIEEFITREGTDYGLHEARFETKVEQVRQLLQDGKATIVFDAEAQTCDIREVSPFAVTKKPGAERARIDHG